MKRVFNFNAGPATLPLEVLEEIHAEWFDFAGTGESILEIRHRGEVFGRVLEEAEEDVRTLLGVDDRYAVMFLSGGANLHFHMIPLNFLTEGKTAAYVMTSFFSDKALKEAEKIGKTFIAYRPENGIYDRVPAPEEVVIPECCAYVHVTSNNTAEGTEMFCFPDTGNVPLIADMTSDLLTHPLDMEKFSLIYAGVQKNIGPAGTVLVVAKKDFLRGRSPALANTLNYEIQMENHSMYNTPPVFAVYTAGKVVKWILRNGGLAGMEKQNREKAELLYHAVDQHPDFYRPYAQKDSRSLMNVVFTLPSAVLEKRFVAEAAEQDLCGLKGHKATGGIRASIYNAMPSEGCRRLAAFMDAFYAKYH